MQYDLNGSKHHCHLTEQTFTTPFRYRLELKAAQLRGSDINIRRSRLARHWSTAERVGLIGINNHKGRSQLVFDHLLDRVMYNRCDWHKLDDKLQMASI